MSSSKQLVQVDPSGMGYAQETDAILRLGLAVGSFDHSTHSVVQSVVEYPEGSIAQTVLETMPKVQAVYLYLLRMVEPSSCSAGKK